MTGNRTDRCKPWGSVGRHRRYVFYAPSDAVAWDVCDVFLKRSEAEVDPKHGLFRFDWNGSIRRVLSGHGDRSRVEARPCIGESLGLTELPHGPEGTQELFRMPKTKTADPVFV